MSSFWWFLFAFWAVVYAMRKKYQHKAILPLTVHNEFSTPNASVDRFRFYALEIKVGTFRIDVVLPEDKLGFLADYFGDRKLLRQVLMIFYSTGSVISVLGLFLCSGALIITSYNYLSVFKYQNNPAAIDNGVSHIAKQITKRSVDAVTMGATNTVGDTSFGITPIIPGVTIPWSQTPLLFFALSVALVIHEAGHCLAASLESIPLYSAGVMLLFVIPVAFIGISPKTMDTPPPYTRLRVAGAGIWHNLLTWLVIYFASQSSLHMPWTFIGWKDIQSLGLVILEVQEESPLAYHMSPGSIVSKLDDIPLASTNDISESLWKEYLLSPLPYPGSFEKGWCTEELQFIQQPTYCCSPDYEHQPPEAQLSCFIPSLNEDDGHCIDPVPILTPQNSTAVSRCFTSSDCLASSDSEDMECIRLGKNSELLRITILPPIWKMDNGVRENSKTILWSGPREEVWEQVKVGKISPWSGLLPLWLPGLFPLFFEYLSMMSMSLFALNLLPLPSLDGIWVFRAVLDLITTPKIERDEDIAYDLEHQSQNSKLSNLRKQSSCRQLLNTKARSTLLQVRWMVRRWKGHIEKSIRIFTLACIAIIALGMIRNYLR